MEQNDQRAIESEIGDLLFSVAQLARHYDLDPEQALRKCNRRFEGRFFKMKEIAESEGEELESLSSEELEGYWQKAKQQLS